LGQFTARRDFLANGHQPGFQGGHDGPTVFLPPGQPLGGIQAELPGLGFHGIKPADGGDDFRWQRVERIRVANPA